MKRVFVLAVSAVALATTSHAAKFVDAMAGANDVQSAASDAASVKQIDPADLKFAFDRTKCKIPEKFKDWLKNLKRTSRIRTMLSLRIHTIFKDIMTIQHDCRENQESLAEETKAFACAVGCVVVPSRA